jgi:hypothetical protein
MQRTETRFTLREHAWIETRAEKFAQLQDKLNRVVKEYAAGKEAAVESQIAEIQGRVDSLLDEISARRQSAVETMRESVSALGQAATLQRGVGRLREKAATANREALKAINEKAADTSDRIEGLRDQLDEISDAMIERKERRQFVIDRLGRERDVAEAELPAQLRRDATVKLLGAVNTESEFAIVFPGWRERSAFYGDLQRGTIKGEIARSVLQFKSFPWAFLQRGMDLVANQDTPSSKAAMVAYLVVATSVAGAMILQTREVLSGKDPRGMVDENWYKFWGAAFLQGGALGIYGDFLYSVNQTRYGSGPLEALAGPTMGPILELGLVQPLTAAKKAIEGKPTHLAAQTVQDLKGFIPGSNIWYTKAALDHLIWQNVLEALSPGYLGAIRERTAREYSQEWWWQPGEFEPERAPDFGKAISR